MKAPIAAVIYDFDKTLCTKDMQEYAFIPALGMTARGTSERIENCLHLYKLPTCADADENMVSACLKTMPRFEAAVPERVGWCITRQLDSAFLASAWKNCR